MEVHLPVLVRLELAPLAAATHAHEVREHTRADDRAEQTDVVRVSVMARAGFVHGAPTASAVPAPDEADALE